MDNTIFMIELLIALILYMLPTLIAFARDIPHRFLINVLNIVFGWTLIGWIICFLWSLMEHTEAEELG